MGVSKIWVQLAIVSALTSVSLSAEPNHSTAPEDAAATSTAEVPTRHSRIELVPQISVVNPGSFTLSNGTFAAHYSRSSFGLPAFFIGGAYRIASLPNLDFILEGKLGYGAKSGTIAVSRLFSDGREAVTLNTPVSLHWLPVTVSGRVLWSIPGVTFFKPTLAAGLGTNFLFQSSELDGFNATYVLPSFHITPGITILDAQRGGGDWFGGLTFGFTFLSTFATVQTMQGTSVDLSMNILL